MKNYFFLVFLSFGLIGAFSGYADEICPQNKDIFEYKSTIKEAFDNVDLEIVDDLSKKLDAVLEVLSFDCAEQLVGQGMDEELFQAGFPALITSIAPDIVIDSFENILLSGNHKYFVKDNERILSFLKHDIEERDKNFLMRSLYDLDKWRKIHDFVLAAKFSLEVNSEAEEMKIQAEHAYNPLDFALYLPIWQGAERREQFSQLCLALGCRLDGSQACSIETTDDLWGIKEQYFANGGNLFKTIYECRFFERLNDSSDEAYLLSLGQFMNHAINFRRIGILNSNCDLGMQLKYIESQGFDEVDNCKVINDGIDG